MSYSFGVRGATKAEVIANAVAELGKVVASQPIHSVDCVQAQAAVEAFVGVIPANTAKDFYVSVSGSLGWDGITGVDAVVTSASVNVSAYLVAKES
jgi:hypothetical protein